MAIGLTTFQNGIKNQAKDFGKSASSVLEKVPGDGIFIAMYTPTRGLWKDVNSTLDEKFRLRETPEVIMTRQAMTAFVETLEKVNPKLLWFHVNHSRAGAMGCAAIEGMTGKGKELLQTKLLWFGVAPAEPLAKKMAIESKNVYSTADCITGPYGEGYQKMEEHLPEEEKVYDIKFLPYDTLLTGGHGFRTKSYQKALREKIEDYEDKYGFYKKNR